MKYILSFFLILLFADNSGAQSISAGIRSGIGNSMDITQLRSGTIDRTWQKEVFTRYETKKRLAIELSGTQYNDAEAGIWHSSGCIVDYEPLLTFAPPTRENILTYTSYNMVDISLGIQYDLSCPFLQEKCPLMKNFRSFLGVAFVGTIGSATTYSTNRSLSDGGISTTELKQKGLHNLNIGINHTTTYSFEKIFISSMVGYMASPFTNYSFSTNQPIENSKLSLRMGIGYKIY